MIIKHKNFDPNKRNIHNTTALYDAVVGGKERFVQELIAEGADPKVYCSGNLLYFAIVEITSLALSLNSTWNYEGALIPNKDLGRMILDFYNRREKFSPIVRKEIRAADARSSI